MSRSTVGTRQSEREAEEREAWDLLQATKQRQRAATGTFVIFATPNLNVHEAKRIISILFLRGTGKEYNMI
jgi:hypothetical protein